MNARAEAMDGYNDDLVMSYSIALWVRDTALRIKKDRDGQQWAMMDTMLDMNGNKPDHTEGFQAGKLGMPPKNPYEMEIKGEKEDLSWLLK